MDIIRQLTMIHPVDTFLFGADWLLQRATQTPAADVQRMLLFNKINLCCIKYNIFVHLHVDDSGKNAGSLYLYCH